MTLPYHMLIGGPSYGEVLATSDWSDRAGDRPTRLNLTSKATTRSSSQLKQQCSSPIGYYHAGCHCWCPLTIVTQ